MGKKYNKRRKLLAAERSIEVGRYSDRKKRRRQSRRGDKGGQGGKGSARTWVQFLVSVSFVPK